MGRAGKRDLITEVPGERFDTTQFVDPGMPRPGKSYTDAGGFLTDIAGFDAAYFGISPKEAAQMDPQHRMLLEMAVEACDGAGVAPASLAGSDTAVFVGISDNSYGALQMLAPEGINAYTMAGAASSIAANRLSHFLDLRGPSLIVDTACSSSLVALVHACQTLLAGTSRTALVGGVNVLLSPYHFVGFCQASMLSPTGRCRSFSAGADGYVRAEGGGVVLLKRLADALADGDRVRAVIVGSAANSDGRTPFYGVDLTALLHQPDLAARQFAEVAGLIRSGRYRPLPHSVYPASRIDEAFRPMQHSRHIGKVVVAFDPLDEPLTVERRAAAPRLDPQGTYLVAGGLSGFGAASARWLADRGARRLALVGRRGGDSPEAPALLAELAERGVGAVVHAADVTDAGAMRRIVAEADAAGHPLRGVVHSAMHLDDAGLTDLTDERFRAVLAPKLAGGAVLDEVAGAGPLDLFLVYSSAAAVGNVAQSPYVAQRQTEVEHAGDTLPSATDYPRG